jgi:hypothetical protein
MQILHSGFHISLHSEQTHNACRISLESLRHFLLVFHISAIRGPSHFFCVALLTVLHCSRSLPLSTLLSQTSSFSFGTLLNRSFTIFLLFLFVAYVALVCYAQRACFLCLLRVSKVSIVLGHCTGRKNWNQHPGLRLLFYQEIMRKWHC